MIGSCSVCGNYKRDKSIEGERITCPVCGHSWVFKKRPIYFLTGCSGIGKTTTGQMLQMMTEEVTVLDADMFYSLLNPQTEEAYYEMVEQVLSLTKNLNQSGRPVIWTMAGCIDKIPETYSVQFFSEVRVLALTADEAIIRKRMTEGRKITDTEWIQSSVDYNEYFKNHNRIGKTTYECLDCSNKKPEQVASQVLDWIRSYER